MICAEQLLIALFCPIGCADIFWHVAEKGNTSGT